MPSASRSLVFKCCTAKNRELCTNNTDFITMEPLKEIKINRFISYKDTDDFIYGFDIVSLYNLIFKNNQDIKNPYNRKNIPDFVLKNMSNSYSFD